MRTEVHKEDERGQGSSACVNCGAMMPDDLRFCRACGNRLGEGIEEYTETVRLDGAPRTGPAGRTRTAPTPGNTVTSRISGGFGRMVPKPAPLIAGLNVRRACKRVPKWMIWVFVPMILLSMMGVFSSSKRIIMRRAQGSAASSAPRSYIGADLETENGGAFVQSVSPPGSAADKAGLIGGDTITSFDGKPVKSESELINLLSATPVGKTVDVIYVRDGETKTAKLTTVSEKDNDNFRETFVNRPRGLLGVDDDEFKRVQIPNTNIYGVQMNDVYKNRPGYIAGLRSGDIVIEFDGVPVRTPGELNMRIDRAVPDSTVNVVVMRGTERLVIPVKMGEG